MKWYFIDKKYINFLKKFDYKVSKVDYGENKMKGFIGVVLQKENNTNYFAPVTSYKKKFEEMADKATFGDTIPVGNFVKIDKAKMIDIYKMCAE